MAGQRVTLITGELGFLYDANAFHLQPLPADLRIAVIHNGGGGIFRWLDGPERTGLGPSHFEWQHDTELRPLCDLHGLIHDRVEDEDSLKSALMDWWSPAEAPKVLEIVTPSEESATAYFRYMEAVRG
jgi:2-succinyl-5-enolpyruvyl-6-hydroxy-3-cyclohexene-1-carboxylate synthase